ncbi:hypothetical protein, partial [Nitrospira sp. BLG_2]|uniref:hypothetical protein n=1 Tax=Nitrospira sp. BLG_2 TaxID=3397507 RepID=UPI003B9AF2A4
HQGLCGFLSEVKGWCSAGFPGPNDPESNSALHSIHRGCLTPAIGIVSEPSGPTKVLDPAFIL